MDSCLLSGRVAAHRAALPDGANVTSLAVMIPRRYLNACLAVLLLLAGATAGARDGADPAINRPYQDPDFQQWVERFERPGREVYDRRREIRDATGIRPGMRVADIGAGTGLFTLLFARAVGPTGQVYAVDVSATFVDKVLRRARGENLANVTAVVSTQTETRHRQTRFTWHSSAIPTTTSNSRGRCWPRSTAP